MSQQEWHEEDPPAQRPYRGYPNFAALLTSPLASERVKKLEREIKQEIKEIKVNYFIVLASRFYFTEFPIKRKI